MSEMKSVVLYLYYYVQDMTFYADGTPATNSDFVVPTELGTYDFSKAKSFLVRSDLRLH